MKRFFVMALFVCAGIAASAQSKDAPLKEYVGKYTFPEGSFVTAAEITLADTVLSVSSLQGGSPLERRGKDTFALTAFEGGMMYFYRNASGQVAKIKVTVDDILLEGSKEGVPTAWYNRKEYFNNAKQKQAR